MAVKSLTRKIGVSQRKLRLLADVVKGMQVDYAVSVLKYTNKGGASYMMKAISSAVANAKHNKGVSSENLYVGDIRVDRGRYLKRVYYTGKGGARFLQKPSSHITVILLERGEKLQSNVEKKPVTKTEVKQEVEVAEVKEKVVKKSAKTSQKQSGVKAKTSKSKTAKKAE